MQIPEINKRNFQKTLRELDLSKYPSFQDEYLLKVREKLKSKQKLTLTEELLGFARFNAYLQESRKEFERYLIKNLDFTQYSFRAPKNYQETGIKFLLQYKRCILADDTGLGKSLQVVIAALSLPQDYKVLIVTKNTLKYNIHKEILFYNNSSVVIEKKWETDYKFTIINYEGLKKYLKQAIDTKFDIIIADECHVLTNSKSARSVAFKKLETKTKYEKLWLLTGTPITNRPINLFPLLQLCKHELAKNWVHYVESYCDGKKNEFDQWVVSGASNLSELHEKTKDVILRRLKIDYLHDLPAKDRQPIWLKLTDRKSYDGVIEEYKRKKREQFEETYESVVSLFNEGDFVDVNEMTKLVLWRQFCALQKVKDGSLVTLIQEALDEGRKIIVFSNFTAVLDEVFEKFSDGICSKILDGRVKKPQDRLALIEEFNSNEELRILPTNIQVGGTGNNVQSADYVIVNDMDWVPGNMLQAEDRAWRLGQKKQVDVRYLIYMDTVEEVLYKVIDAKMRNITTAIDGEEERYFNDYEQTQKGGFIKKKDYDGPARTGTFEVTVTKKSPEEIKKGILKEIFSKL